MKNTLFKNYWHVIYLFLALSVACNIAVAQSNSVVVIPMGSDVSSEQFNDLVRQVNQQRVLAGRVSSDGSKVGEGDFTPVRLEEGTYSVSFGNLTRFEFQASGTPAILVTSFDTHRIPMVTDVFGFAEDTPNGRIITTLNFTVVLRAFDNNIADSDFSFMVKIPQGS